jgi:hypothetical protein
MMKICIGNWTIQMDNFSCIFWLCDFETHNGRKMTRICYIMLFQEINNMYDFDLWLKAKMIVTSLNGWWWQESENHASHDSIWSFWTWWNHVLKIIQFKFCHFENYKVCFNGQDHAKGEPLLFKKLRYITSIIVCNKLKSWWHPLVIINTN